MPNADTFKKLLEEMATKESLYTEELKVIEQEIEQLESRIVTCRERLSTVGDDKGTVSSIAEHYTKELLDLGKIALDFSLPLRKSAAIDTNPEQTAKESPKTNGKSTAKGQNGTKSKQEEATPAKSDVKGSSVSKPAETKPEQKVQEAAKTEVKAEAKSPAKAEPKSEEKTESKADEGFILDLGEEASKDKPSEEENQSGESEDETIKSINDALRGLFR